MAYDKKVIFEVKKSSDSDEKNEFVFDNCLYGWFVKDEELSEMMIDGELEYKAILSADEMVKRFEANKLQFEKDKKANDSYAKWYLESTEKPDINFLKDRKIRYIHFERLVYDRRLVRVIFHKFWWESGLN